jgi:pyrroline-5-carboxylate reductase
MGGALLSGWRDAGLLEPKDVQIIDPVPGAEALAAAALGARLDPSDADVATARTVLLAVKPQLWRAASAPLAPRLGAEAVVVSIAAGVRLRDLEAMFARPCARVMPTTAVAVRKGAASIYAPDAAARARATALFSPVATVVRLSDEDLLDAATAVSGSAPAYLYALMEALEAAGKAEGLAAEEAGALVRATLIGAAALMEASGEAPAELRRQVTSKAGTTEAALRVLQGPSGLPELVLRAVQAATARSRELAG